MVTKEELEEVVVRSGLWSNGSRLTHGFVLSPEVYVLDMERRIDLEKLAAAIHDCLRGLARIAYIATNDTLGSSKTWRHVASVCRAGLHRQYGEIAFINPHQYPLICKVDLLEGVDGKFYVVEIDAHNKHGLGYAVLARRFASVMTPNGSHTFPGVAAEITKIMTTQGQDKVALVWAKQESFYLPESHIFRDEMATHGISVRLVAEAGPWYERVRDLGIRFDSSKPELFVDIPPMYHDSGLRDWLVGVYKKRTGHFLIPPKPYLGSKGILALLANQTGDPGIEAILLSQISVEALNKLREHLPKTYPVTRFGSIDYDKVLRDGHWVLKEGISSGMKGVVFSDEPGFQAGFDLALRARNSFVLQEEVENKPERFAYFDDNGELKAGQYFKRLTMHIARRKIAEVTVTARTDRKIHGAKDCLQLGTAIVDNVKDFREAQSFEAKKAYLDRVRAAGLQFEDVDFRL